MGSLFLEEYFPCFFCTNVFSEGLQDAVAYAREITTQSMEQFVRRHHDSIARLQQSYRHISEQAQLLMQQFSQTLDEMKKLQVRLFIEIKTKPNGNCSFLI